MRRLISNRYSSESILLKPAFFLLIFCGLCSLGGEWEDLPRDGAEGFQGAVVESKYPLIDVKDFNPKIYSVMYELIVRKSGKVDGVRLLKPTSNPKFVKYFMDEISPKLLKLKFTPGKLNNEPVDCVISQLIVVDYF